MVSLIISMRQRPSASKFLHHHGKKLLILVTGLVLILLQLLAYSFFLPHPQLASPWHPGVNRPPGRHDHHDNRIIKPLPRSMNETPNNNNNNKHVEDVGSMDLAASQLARVFPPWPLHLRPLPCYPADLPTQPQRRAATRPFQMVSQPSSRGFFFMKLMKCGGSTAAGIHVRLLNHLAAATTPSSSSGNHTNNLTYCRGKWDHDRALSMLGLRIRAQSFTWTMLRDPTARAVSQYFHFQVSRLNQSTDDAEMQAFFLREDMFRHYYLQFLTLNEDAFLAMSSSTQEVDPAVAPDVVKQILWDYDLIGITERLDESAVVLMMLLQIPMALILYLSAKQSGGYDDGRYGAGCTYIQPSFVSPGMQQFFDSPAWQARIRYDQLLYQAAQHSLDRAIDQLGRARVQQYLTRYQQAQQRGQQQCGKAQEFFPCTSTGRRNRHASCLWKDSGCGWTCLDEVATELGLWDYPDYGASNLTGNL